MTRRTSKEWPLVATAVLALVGCGSRTVTIAADAAASDLAIPDAAPRPPDLRLPDLRLPDLCLPDLPPPDLRPATLPPATVLYYDSPWPGSQQLLEIGSDGKGLQPSPGLGQALQLRGLGLSGMYEMWLDRSRPGGSGQATDYASVSLPGGTGVLHGYSSGAGVGVLVVRPGGQVTSLDFTRGPVKGSRDGVAVDPSGALLARVAALASGLDEVRLVRSDGKVFSATGTGACSVTPAAAPTISTEAGSLTLAGGWLFFLTQLTSAPGREVLMRAPADCSAPAKVLPLPRVNGAAPLELGTRLERSQDGSTIALVARYQDAKGPQEVIVVDASTGKATNVSAAPGQYLEVRWGLMHDHAPWGASTSLSPRGTRLAYTQAEGAAPTIKHSLHIKDISAPTKPAVVLSSATRLPASHVAVDAPTWLSENDLIFWSGPGLGTRTDLYHYRLSSDALGNLTNSGSKPRLGPRGGWWSRNKKYLYYLEHRPPPAGGTYGTSDIKALERATGKRLHVTTDLNVNGAFYSAEAAPGSGRVFFSASPRAQISGRSQDLYLFDQDTASATVRLTHFAAPPQAVQNIYGITTDARGTAAALSLGSTPLHHIYVVQVGPPVKVHKLTSGLVATRRRKLFDPAGKTLFHISRSASGTWDLLGQPITGGSVKVLCADLGKDSSVLAVW